MEASDPSGFTFTVGLCDAIETVGDAIEQHDPAAFSYRGISLRGALERYLFTTAVNDRRLQRAFLHDRRARLQPASGFERDVAARLLEVEPRARLRPPIRRRLAPLAGPLYAAANRVRPADRSGADLIGAHPEVAILIDHDKFVEFMAPVVSRFETREVVVLAADLQRRRLHAAGTPYVPIDLRRPVCWPRRAQLGSALRAAPHLAAEYDRFVGVLAKLRPHCLIVIEGNGALDEVAARAARSCSIPSLCVQQGWAPVVTTGFRRLSFDAMAVWGDGFAQILSPYSPGQRFVTTGSPALGATRTEGRLSAVVAGRPCVGFFLQTVTQLISPAAMSGLLDLASQLAQDAPDVAVLVREHPGHRIDTGHLERLSSPNLILTPPDRYSLADVLSACDTVVSICSTTLLEAAALGTPPVILNQTSLPRYMPDLARIGAGIETRDPAIARHEVLRLLRDPDARERFARGMERVREHFFAGADTRAPDRIVGLVRELGSEASR